MTYLEDFVNRNVSLKIVYIHQNGHYKPIFVMTGTSLYGLDVKNMFNNVLREIL